MERGGGPTRSLTETSNTGRTQRHSYNSAASPKVISIVPNVSIIGWTKEEAQIGREKDGTPRTVCPRLPEGRTLARKEGEEKREEVTRPTVLPRDM